MKSTFFPVDHYYIVGEYSRWDHVKNWSDSKENKNIIKTEDLHLFVLRKSQAAAKSFVYKKSSSDHQQQVNKPTQER